MVRDYSLEKPKHTGCVRGCCSLQASLLSKLSAARLLDHRGGQVLEDTSDAGGRSLVSFHLRHKNPSCLLSAHARTRTHRVETLAAVLAGWKREGWPAGRCQANPTQRNLPRLTCCRERGGTEWPRFGWKPLQTFPNMACGRVSEWAGERGLSLGELRWL